MNLLLDKLNAEKKSLSDSEDKIIAAIHTNNRRVDYQAPELERLIYIRAVLMMILKIVLVIAFRVCNKMGILWIYPYQILDTSQGECFGV